jgi:hypothetical protein
MYWVRGSRSSATGTASASTCPSTGVMAVTARLIVGWDTPNDSAISACTRFLRKYVKVATTDLNNPRIGGQETVLPSATAAFTRTHNCTIWSLVKPVV